MGANSAARRLVKKALYPVLNEHTYRYLQAASKAWDIRSGKWTEPEVDLLPLAVRAGDTALDIGANFGLYCHHLARVVGAGRRASLHRRARRRPRGQGGSGALGGDARRDVRGRRARRVSAARRA